MPFLDDDVLSQNQSPVIPDRAVVALTDPDCVRQLIIGNMSRFFGLSPYDFYISIRSPMRIVPQHTSLLVAAVFKREVDNEGSGWVLALHGQPADTIHAALENLLYESIKGINEGGGILTGEGPDVDQFLRPVEQQVYASVEELQNGGPEWAA